MNLNILVTGANGQLGNEMRLISKQTTYNFLFTDVVAPEVVETTILDITDVEAVEKMVQEHYIGYIVNCAVYTNVNKAESDAALCHKLNATAPKILTEAIKAVIDDYTSEALQSGYCKTGIYHFSNEGICSWYDFTKVIVELAGNTACDIQPCHSKEFPNPVTRLAYSVLDKTKIKQTFGLKIPYWIDSLKTCMINLK